MSSQPSKKETVLVVDDVQKNLELMVEYLIEADFEVFVAKNGEDALKKLQRVSPDIILLDIILPGMDGFELCSCIKKMETLRDIPVIFMTALADENNKVKGFDVGGVDYITKPIKRQETLSRVNTHLTLRKMQKALHDANENLEDRVIERTAQLNRALEKVEQLKDQVQAQNVYLREEIKNEHNFGEIIGTSEVLQKVLKRVERVADADTTVLILGETGTGKELIARALHNGGGRSKHPLVKVNCAAMPAHLIESELFGHEKGAFTGAVSRKIGRFELAHEGTIFLDEIGDLPIELQPKLLRALQEGEIERLGNSQSLSVNVRVIAATNRNLERAMEDTQFRQDLFFRLNVFPVNLPPLRDRPEDIPLLAEHFVSKVSAKLGKPISRISQDVLDQLKSYRWPGNIRELENLVERAVVLATGPSLEVEYFEFSNNSEQNFDDSSQVHHDNEILSLEEMERRHILKVLQRCSWKIQGCTGAAKALKINSSTLRSRMKKLGIRKP